MGRETKKSGGVRWRLWAGLVLVALAGAASAVAARKVRHYVIGDPRFRLSRESQDALDIQGLEYASRWRVQRVFAGDFDRSVFSIPLDERRRRLLAIDWVEDASVSRVWPNRLTVRIRERRPVAFVLLRAEVLLIDAHGVLLEPPPKAHFTFPVLGGIRGDETEAERRDRVRVFVRVEKDMGQLFGDVSEVNASDPDDVRLVARVENRVVELAMGDGSFARRYQNFLAHFPEIRKRSPGVKTFDLRLDDRITAKE